jgi:hypothetical protein
MDAGLNCQRTEKAIPDSDLSVAHSITPKNPWGKFGATYTYLLADAGGLM